MTYRSDGAPAALRAGRAALDSMLRDERGGAGGCGAGNASSSRSTPVGKLRSGRHVLAQARRTGFASLRSLAGCHADSLAAGTWPRGIPELTSRSRPSQLFLRLLLSSSFTFPPPSLISPPPSPPATPTPSLQLTPSLHPHFACGAGFPPHRHSPRPQHAQSRALPGGNASNITRDITPSERFNTSHAKGGHWQSR